MEGLSKNYYLIKYENQLKIPPKNFFRYVFLTKITNSNFDKDKIIKSIEQNNFNNLKKIEKNLGFREAVKDKIQIIQFF